MEAMINQNARQQTKNAGKFLSLVLIAGLGIFITACDRNHEDTAKNVTPNLQLVAENMVSPIDLVEAPDDSKRLFVVDQVGKIWVVSNGALLPTPFLDVSSKMIALSSGYDERGLLGLAFHPDYKTNGRFFVYYTAPSRTSGFNHLGRIAEFKVSSSNANQADMSSEKMILEWDHPQGNHNGGTLAFGPDGYLYISIGDGGGSDDVGTGHVSDWYATNTGGNGQDIYANLLGNILRININSGNPYSIPADNPFVGTNAKGEIYAYGFRNPYRFSFDMGGTRQMFAGDAGQVLYEEIDIVTKGGNYGWNVKEGTHCFNTNDNKTERTSCPSVDSAGKPLIDPVIELKNAAHPAGGGIATVIVGGHVYRGNALPAYKGRYIFGIFSQKGGSPDGKIFAANAATSGLWTYDDIPLKDFPSNLGQYLKGFGQGLDGEIYLLTSGQQGPSGTTGKVYKLVGVQ